MFKGAVFRRFSRLFCGAIFALSVVFVSQNAFAVSCSTGTAGQYKITKYCYSCPAGCYCSGQDANGLDPSGNGKVDISESDVIAWCNSGTTCPWTAGSGQCGQSDAAHIYRCPSSHPNSAASATLPTSCYKTTSLAAGKYLDAIGSVLDCPRNYYCPSRTSFNAYYGTTYNNKQCPKSGYEYTTKDGQLMGSINTDDSNWTGTNTVNTKSSQITECYRYKKVSELPGCTAGEVRQFFTNKTYKETTLEGTVVHTITTSSYGGNLTIGTALKAANGYYVNGTQCSACAANAQQPSYGSSVTYCTCKAGYSGGGGTSDPSGANCVATNVDVDINSVTISDCPAYESTDEADTAHFKPNSVVGNTKTGSDYYYYIVEKGSAQNNSGLSRCQTFFNVDNSLIPHTATDIPGYTHTMIRAVYSVADINANGYTASANNYNRSAQIQFSGVSRNISLHCEDGYANKLAANGMIYYSTLNEALANACTKIENGNYSDDGVVERVCPIGYYCENGEKTECPTGTTSPAGSTSVDQCVASSYTITYNLNSGTGCSNTTYTFGNTVTLCTPTRDGYIFNGWYDNSGLTGTAVATIPSGSTGNKTYYAKWEQAKFTVTTTQMTANDTFKWSMSAAGTFYVDCGDGGVLSGTGVSGNKIDRENNTSDATYTCTYSAAGAHTLRFGGSADGYNASQAAIRFNISASPSSDENAEKIASISGSLGRIFRTRVNATVGNPQPKFIQTFSVAKNMICQIPADLFDGIYGSPVEAMFSSTFNGCSGLTGSIPETLFCQNPNNPGVNNCIYGTPAQNMFVFTFNGCSSLTGTDISDPYNPGKKYAIPPKLFVGISGDPASAMFKATFQNCSKLAGTIPSGLFANIVGSPKGEMFWSTFRGCKKLTGSIPATLFSGISGAPATQMFDATFYNCSGLTGSISSDLFAGISGDPKSEMFGSTFHNCSGLNSITEGTKTTTYIPGTFLSSINTASASETGNPALNMFYGTNLDDSCPIGTRNVTRPPFNNAAKPWCALNTITLNWNENGGDAITNESCVYGDDLELPSAPTRTGYTFAGWKTADNVIRDAGTIITEGCTNTYTGVTQGYSTAITAQWTEIEYPFSLTTTSMTANDTFKWSMSAAGTFYVDCGDGGVLSGTGVSGNTITRSNTTMAQYTCTYPNAGKHTIKFGGTATGYNATSGSSYAAIGFSTTDYSNNTPTKIAGISGSLGAIFGTIGAGDTLTTQPRFINTFAGCSGLTGSIPENLFAGISGAPANSMFYQTFYDCNGLTGSIPEKLFAGINGKPIDYMFTNTFYNCSGLTGAIPVNLFAGIKGAPATDMFGFTFWGCSGLTGSIPEKLFAGITGTPAERMFRFTFTNCSGLTGSIPEKLFAGISGAPATSMFEYTFAGCSKLTGFTDGPTTTSYVPATFLSGITTNTSVSNQALYMFSNTGLASPCPANTYNVTREQFSNAGKPWCAPCPDGTHYNGTGATTVNQCCLSGYDWNGTTCASLTISLSYTDKFGATYDGPNSCNINETFILPPAPTKTGYTFTGWTLVEN